MAEFETYKERQIEFHGVRSSEGWHIKIYTITVNNAFQSEVTLKAVIRNLSTIFTNGTNGWELPMYQQAFVVIHEAREGVWILFSWWTGGEMLASKLRFSSYGRPLDIGPPPYKSSDFLICVWELEIYAHERKAWIRHVLKRPDSPDFISYQNDGLNEN